MMHKQLISFAPFGRGLSKSPMRAQAVPGVSVCVAFAPSVQKGATTLNKGRQSARAVVCRGSQLPVRTLQRSTQATAVCTCVDRSSCPCWYKARRQCLCLRRRRGASMAPTCNAYASAAPARTARTASEACARVAACRERGLRPRRRVPLA